MNTRIAIVGAGITGLMTAKSCATRGAQVDVYDAGPIPNPAGRSYANGRLWRHVHPGNPRLQELARQSLPRWKTIISDGGVSLGQVVSTIRVVSEEEAHRLAELYRQAQASFRLESYWTSAQRCLYHLRHKSDVLFTGHDGLLLNARSLCHRLAEELSHRPGVRLLAGAMLDITQDVSGTSVHNSGVTERYDRVVLATGEPTEKLRGNVRRRFQVHLDVTPADSRAASLSPVLDMGDELVSWAVPSPDRKEVTISASSFSYSEEPDATTRERCWDYLAAQIRFGYVRAEKRLSVYHELPAEERRITPFWHRDPVSGAYVLDACDGGLFKVAPALADALTADIFEGK